jgi:hypothetical protein
MFRMTKRKTSPARGKEIVALGTSLCRAGPDVADPAQTLLHLAVCQLNKDRIASCRTQHPV